MKGQQLLGILIVSINIIVWILIGMLISKNRPVRSYVYEIER
jgi:flagellar biosynthesis component FlhA